MDEAALHRKIGGIDMMNRQLRHLIELTELPHVALQVLPFESGTHRGVNGAFTIMDVGEQGDLRVVTVDSLTQISYREEADEIRTYAATFDNLRNEALSKADSRSLIEELRSRA